MNNHVKVNLYIMLKYVVGSCNSDTQAIQHIRWILELERKYYK